MLICDQYLAIRAIADDIPNHLRNEHLAIASSHYWLLLRAAAKQKATTSEVMGQLSRLIAELSPAAKVELATPLPEVIEVLDFREYAHASANAAHEFGLKWLVADLVGSSLHYQAPLCFGRESNIPPAIRNNNFPIPVPYTVVTRD